MFSFKRQRNSSDDIYLLIKATSFPDCNDFFYTWVDYPLLKGAVIRV